ncbi:MAG: hypothetical protein ACJ77A_00335 [Actinomycetota bacterium]
MGRVFARLRYRRILVVMAVAGLISILLVPVARASTVSIRHRNVEGRLSIGVGEWIAAGYRFRFAPKHPSATVQFADPTFTSSEARCVGTGAPVTLVVTAPTATYSIPQNDMDFVPGKRRVDRSTFQGSARYGVHTPDLCHGRRVDLSGGFIFSADVTSEPADARPMKIQFHYQVPAASGLRNIDCATVTSGVMCRAGWSAPTSLPDPVTYTPLISTTPTIPFGLGGSMGDSATITGAAPAAGGTVTFRAFGPSDQDCLGPEIFDSTIIVSADSAGSAAVTSGTFPLTQFGRYLWTAEYSGDPGTGTQPAASGCGDEVVDIAASAP